MADHPHSDEVLKRRTPGIALLLTALVVALILWESLSLKMPPPKDTVGRQSTARRIRELQAQVEIRPVPMPMVAPTPPPPLSPAPALEPTPPVDPTTLRVSDIVIDPMDPAARFAVINGLAVRAGETIGGHRVQKVLPDRVLIGEEGTVVLLPSKEDRQDAD